MRKRKLLSIVLILFALLFPLLIASVSISTLPVEGALLFQAINTKNSQTMISELNQPYIQITSITKENFESVDLQQKEISAKACSFYEAWISSRVDNDYDGYCCELTLRWDADTSQVSENVYVEVYYRDEEDDVGYIGDSGWYYIYGYEASRFEFEYMDIICNVRGTYDFRLVLYSESGYEDELNFGEDLSITNVHMESEVEDNFSFAILFLKPIIDNIQGSSMLPWIIAGIMGLVVITIVYTYYKIRSGREPPTRPSTFPSTGPAPFVPPSSLAKSLGAVPCATCGYVNLPSATFCVRCGSRIDDTP
jgi:hypothetical protein